LSETGGGARRWPPAVVEAFHGMIDEIVAAADERDLRVMRGWRFEKLKGAHGARREHSMRLNDQYRLTFVIRTEGAGDDVRRWIEIIAIEDYRD